MIIEHDLIKQRHLYTQAKDSMCLCYVFACGIVRTCVCARMCLPQTHTNALHTLLHTHPCTHRHTHIHLNIVTTLQRTHQL